MNAVRILALTHLHPSPWYPHKGVFNGCQFEAIGRRGPLQLIVPTPWTRCFRRPLVDDQQRSGLAAGGAPVCHPRLVYPPKMLRNWHGPLYRNCVRRAFLQAVTEFKPEVVLSAWAYPDGWAAVELAGEVGLPAVIKVHGSDVLRMRRVKGREARTVAALRRAEGVIAVSQDIAEHLVMLGVSAKRIKVVRDGIDGNVFRPGDVREARLRVGVDPRRPLILFVGRLAPVKGLDVLVDACERLRDQGLAFDCYLIGDGPLRRRLASQLKRRQLRAQVHLVGLRTHHELADWYRAADTVVLSSYSEGTPCVLLEAAACGTPFVASRVGGIPEIAHLVESRLVPPGEPDALASALADVLNLEREARHATSSRSHSVAAAEIAEFLHEVVGAWPGPRRAKRLTGTGECPSALYLESPDRIPNA